MKISVVIQQLNDVLHPLLWGWPVLAAILLTGANSTFRSGSFQFTYCKLWLKDTFGELLSQNSRGRDEISPSQAVSTVLVDSIGTGNIVGVATALALDGAGTIFWMWASAPLGVMMIFSGNVLGVKHRIKSSDGTWLGGAMYYLGHGVHSKVLVMLSSVGCVLASLGMGNMARSNPITGTPQDAFGVALPVIRLVLTVLLAIMTFGGVRRIACAVERLTPFMTISHLLAVGIVLYCHRQALPEVLRQITDEALGLQQVTGGIDGAAMANALKTGVSRGVFTNEAGLGSSITAYSGSMLKESVEQEMRDIFQVFLDTIITCTVTALVIPYNGTLSSGRDGAALSVATFSSIFRNYGGVSISVYVLLFALTTLLGWSYYSECGVWRLVGNRAVPTYRILFTLLVTAGCMFDLHLAWGISDIFNNLMALPNLIALFLLSGEVLDETTNCLVKRRQKEKAEGRCHPLARARYSYSSHSQKYESNKF